MTTDRATSQPSDNETEPSGLMNECLTMCSLESLNVLKVERSEAGNAFLKGREVLSSYHEDGTRQTLAVCGQQIM